MPNSPPQMMMADLISCFLWRFKSFCSAFKRGGGQSVEGFSMDRRENWSGSGQRAGFLGVLS